MQNNLNLYMELRFFMLFSIKILKKLILCINQITDNEIKEYYDMFHKISLDIFINYISLLKVYLLITRMYILGLNINKILKDYNLKHPLDFISLKYEQCDDFELEYIINFYNFIVTNIKKIYVVKILFDIFKKDKDKYNDIKILMKAKNNKALTHQEFNRLLYLKNIFKEYRISYIIKREEYIKIFNYIPNVEDVYQDIDESSNDKYLIWKDYRNVKV